MPRKSRKKAESPATDPTPVAELLAQSPIAEILASREAKSQIEPERPMSEPPATETELTHVQRLSQPRGLRPTPTGFKGLEGHYAAGIRLNRSLDKNVVGIQFSDDHKPS